MLEASDLKKLAKLIDLLRKKGVSSCSIGGITLSLSPEAPPSPYKRRQQAADTTPAPSPADLASDEERALFWSSDSPLHHPPQE